MGAYAILWLMVGKWSKGGIPPAFEVKQGYRQNTAAGDALTCPKLAQIPFRRASKVPAALAEHAHGANGTAVGGGWYSTWYQLPGKLVFS